MFTGRLSLATHSWLAEHAVCDTVLVPGATFVDLALAAGAKHVQELVISRPLIVPDKDGVQLRVEIGAPDETGSRTIDIHSRIGNKTWTHHATGSVTDEPHLATTQPAAWPPADAQPLDISGFYQDLADLGYGYGPLFQGVQAAWRDGDSILTQVALPENTNTDGFGIHPALLDAALHGALLAEQDQSNGTVRLPYTWTGVSLHATGATSLRVRLTVVDEETLALTATDPTGGPVATINALTTRRVTADQILPADTKDRSRRPQHLYHQAWTPVTA
ncbi:polyketide synthase dehydratase domain-containing protein, partial [Actinocrinis puniceicyclus]|uniref:polyketide synthase dehydratase domain-containing protein n=1 Tax=Actinocrinis puniceicyclus TaxID=977794 RepID=UPI0028A7BF4C